MARPVSWLQKLPQIHRRVTNSDRSHWTVRDIQDLFELQPRAAGDLVTLMDREAIGKQNLVPTENLLRFLDRVREADNLQLLFAQIRSEKPTVTRRKIRVLKQHDEDAPDLASLPEAIILQRGHLEIDFRNPLDLAQSLYAISRLIETSEFDRRFCYADLEPAADAREDELARNDMRLLTEDLEAREQAHRISSGRAIIDAMRSGLQRSA